MAAPTTYTTFNIQKFVEEAYGRARVDPQGLTARDHIEARNSIVFMMADWAVRGCKLWQLSQYSQTLTSGAASFDVQSDAIDVLNANIRRVTEVDIILSPYTREDYFSIPDKTTPGMASAFWYNQADSKLYFWPAAENSTDQITYWYFKRLYDPTEGLQDTEIPFKWWDAFVAGLAFRVAQKRADVPLESLPYLEAKANEAFALADWDDFSKNAIVQIYPR